MQCPRFGPIRSCMQNFRRIHLAVLATPPRTKTTTTSRKLYIRRGHQKSGTLDFLLWLLMRFSNAMLRFKAGTFFVWPPAEFFNENSYTYVKLPQNITRISHLFSPIMRIVQVRPKVRHLGRVSGSCIPINGKCGGYAALPNKPTQLVSNPKCGKTIEKHNKPRPNLTTQLVSNQTHFPTQSAAKPLKKQQTQTQHNNPTRFQPNS